MPGAPVFTLLRAFAAAFVGNASGDGVGEPLTGAAALDRGIVGAVGKESAFNEDGGSGIFP